MLTFIFALGLALIMLLAIALNKTYQHITPKEIKRQARNGDKFAQLLYKPISYGVSLQVFLWIVILLTAAGSFVLFSKAAPSILAFIVIVIILGMGFWWLPAARVSSVGGRIAVWLAPVISRLLYYLHPILSKMGRFARRHYPVNIHTGIYDKEDLIDLLEWQKQQPDNRIPIGEIDVVEHALLFGDHAVQDITVPRRVVRLVSAEETIGPLLMDDLHKSGHSRFPVYEGKKDNIVGTLYLRDLISARHGGSVTKVMRPQVFYVHEDFSLYQVLRAFLKTKHHLFIVVNNFEEFTGIITIEDVLEQILGQPILDEFDQYDDLRAVATALAQKEHKDHEKADSEPTEVVE